MEHCRCLVFSKSPVGSGVLIHWSEQMDLKNHCNCQSDNLQWRPMLQWMWCHHCHCWCDKKQNSKRDLHHRKQDSSGSRDNFQGQEGFTKTLLTLILFYSLLWDYFAAVSCQIAVWSTGLHGPCVHDHFGTKITSNNPSFIESWPFDYSCSMWSTVQLTIHGVNDFIGSQSLMALK